MLKPLGGFETCFFVLLNFLLSLLFITPQVIEGRRGSIYIANYIRIKMYLCLYAQAMCRKKLVVH